MRTYNEDLIVNGLIRSRDGFRPATNDWAIQRNGEYLEIREPEQSNKVWARFRDDVCLHLIGTPNLWVEGRIGVNTTSPTAKIDIQAPWSDWMFLRQERDVEGGGGFHIHNPWGNSNQWQGAPERNALTIAYRTSSGQDLWSEGFVFHGPTGNVGLGVPTPDERLCVRGNVKVSGDIALENADCAEEFALSGECDVEAGTVMVLDEAGAIHPSTVAYDRKAAGVVSGAGQFKPAIVLDRRDDGGRRVPIALMGKVMCKVDASLGPIGVGDLLTTSETEGHAMSAIDPTRAFGAVIGKSLGKLPDGTGMVPILVTLQ